MATERSRWFLTEYASRNRHADTHAVLGALARLEAAVRSGGAALALSEPANSSERRRFPDLASAAERIQDIAFMLRERAVDAGLCDALDAAVREIAGVCDHAGRDADGGVEPGSTVAALGLENNLSSPDAAASAMQPSETAKVSATDSMLAQASMSTGPEAAIALKQRNDYSDLKIAPPGRDHDADLASANGSANSQRWYIEPPDFAFHRAAPEHSGPPPAENGYGHSMLPQAQLLPGPQDDPADLFESSADALAAATASDASEPTIVAPAVIAPPVMRPTELTAIR